MRSLDRFGSFALPTCRGASGRARTVIELVGAPAGRLGAGTGREIGRLGRVSGLRGAHSRRRQRFSHVTLLAESSRRVGTAWPEAGCKRDCGSSQGGAKDSRANRFRLAALHNRLEFARIRPGRAELNGSPRRSDDSSRPAEPKVEFVNHPKAVSLDANARWAIRALGWGWGAPSNWDFGGALSRALRELWSGIK